MDFLIDLQRLLWHEFGHLCIDIISTDENPNYQIEQLSVTFNAHALHKWNGYVKVVPSIKFDVLVEDEIKVSYSMITLLSGCIFQTIYLREIEKQIVEFDDCFSLKDRSAGFHDKLYFGEIGSQYRMKFGNRADYTNFIEVELKETLYNQILNNELFLVGMNQISIKYRDLILKKLENQMLKDNLLYRIIDKELEVLKNEIRELMLNTGFYVMVIELIESIGEKMIADKNHQK
jgi:hypothetical protein